MHNLGEFAQRHAFRDDLTGALCRDAGIALVRCLVEGGAQQLTAVVVVVESLNVLNEMWGHACGDQILSAVGQELANYVDANDAVCRWTGGSFVTITNRPSAEVREPARGLEKRLSRHYEIIDEDQTLAIPVTVRLNTVDPADGESADAFTARIDSLVPDAITEQATSAL